MESAEQTTQSLHSYLIDRSSNRQGCVTKLALMRLMGSWEAAEAELDELQAAGAITRWCAHGGEVGYVLNNIGGQ